MSFIQRLKGLLFLFLFILPVNIFAQKTAVAEHGMVAAPTPEAAQAGASILKMGGNAFDAAAATAFALMVTDPAMCSLGGRAQILMYRNDGKIFGIDGATQEPLHVGKPAGKGYGYRTCPVPGAPAALAEMVLKFGTLPLKTLLQPAIKLAREGFIFKQDYGAFFPKYGRHFREFSGTANYFLNKDGSFFTAGGRFIQKELAETLERIAENGVGDLYRGKLAEAIVRDMHSNGGLITAEDLANYRCNTGRIVRGSYRGFQLVSRGDQCDGASLIETLQILEHFSLARYSPSDPEYIHILAQSIYTASIDENLADWLQVTKALADRRAREIELTRLLPVPLKNGAAKDGETNHLSVVDADGNAAAITQSLGPTFGSKVVNPKLGFFYAYSYDMNDNPVPLRRDKTEQSPTLVLKEGKLFLVLGSAGGSRIPPSIIQTIVNVIDHKMNLQEAVFAPRVFFANGELRIESVNSTASEKSALEKLGYHVKLYRKLDGYFAKVHAILIDAKNRKLVGTADPRDYGAAIGY